MSDFETISWRDVPGNKYSKSLNTSMLSETGYVTMQRVKQAYKQARTCYVIYDRDFVITYLVKRILVYLSVLGKDEVNQLIDEAWEQFKAETTESVAS